MSHSTVLLSATTQPRNIMLVRVCTSDRILQVTGPSSLHLLSTWERPWGKQLHHNCDALLVAVARAVALAAAAAIYISIIDSNLTFSTPCDFATCGSNALIPCDFATSRFLGTLWTFLEGTRGDHGFPGTPGKNTKQYVDLSLSRCLFPNSDSSLRVLVGCLLSVPYFSWTGGVPGMCAPASKSDSPSFGIVFILKHVPIFTNP